MSSESRAECKKILIFGATGLVGKWIAKAFVQNKSNFDRIAVFTSPSTRESKGAELEALEKEGVDIIIGDITNSDDVSKAYQGIDTVISCVGRNVIEHQVELIRLADASPTIHRFFPSEYGTDIEYGPSSASEPPHQKKLKVRAAIRACKNLDHTFVVTGPYADGDPGMYFGTSPFIKQGGGFDVKNKEATLLGDGKLKISFTTMHDVGKLVVLSALHPDVSRNRALRVNSFTTTDSEILSEFEKQTGGQPWSVSYVSVNQLKTSEAESWAAQKPIATLFTLKKIWAEGGTLYDKRDNHLIGAEDGLDTLEDAVARAIKIQTS